MAAWSSADDARLLALRDEGKLAKQIATELGRTLSAVQSRTKILKAPRVDANASAAAWTAADDHSLRLRTLAGDAAGDIAVEMGRTQRAVRHRRRYLGISGKSGRPRNSAPSVAVPVLQTPTSVSQSDTPSMRITPKSVASDIAALESELANIQETLGLLYALQRKLNGENASLRAVKMSRPDPAQDRQTAKLRALKYLREDAA